MRIKSLLVQFIKQAQNFGLHDQDALNALDLLEHYEFGLCLDLVITQLYEYDIKINECFYKMISEICNIITIDFEKYLYMNELIAN